MEFENQNPINIDPNFIYPRLLSHVGNLPDLVSSYRKILFASRSKSVQKFYDSRLHIIEDHPKSINSQVGYRQFEKSLTNFNSYSPDQEILIIDSANLRESFLLGDLLARSEIKYRIIDGIAIDNLSILPNRGRFVVIGRGHYSRIIDIMLHNISEGEIEQVIKNFISRPFLVGTTLILIRKNSPGLLEDEKKKTARL